MSIAPKIKQFMEKSSWIRKMFEQGALMKAEFGPENVFDFSLGNPNLDPPPAFHQTLRDLLSGPITGLHSYMANAGLPQTRRAVADFLSAEHGLPFTEKEVIMTCGAAGAINAVFRALLSPGDEIVILAPYFVEYLFYADNFQAVPQVVPSTSDFLPDLGAIEQALTLKTKAVLINSPNNPTGRVYPAAAVNGLGELLRKWNKEKGQDIYLIADEPYRKIVYDGVQVPSIFQAWEESIVVTSYSKDLSIPGERIGYLAVNPQAPDREELINALTLTNRIMGFVNAPALMQKALIQLQGQTVDIGLYRKKRDLFCQGLARAGYQFNIPEGAFYLFPRTPIPDDVAFVQALQEEKILTVPGTGFGAPGHFRIAYCAADEVIERSLPGFARVMEKFNL